MFRSRLTALLLTAIALATVASLQATDFIAGADLSHLAFFESRGVVYREAGQELDALTILKSKGLSCVRLRLFTSTSAQAQANPYNYLNNLEYTVPLAARVKKAGLQFLLDFHYSDTWADPAHQRKPSTWTDLMFFQLVQQVHDYSSNCITAFIAAGAMPDYVQVGNEITGGMLWPDGKVGGSYDTPLQWNQLGQLLNAAITGIREAAGLVPPRIIIHVDRGGDWTGTQWFFDHLSQQNVPFDIIGESYYPFWHGPVTGLSNCLNNAARRYHKPVLVVETAFPWTNSAWSSPVVGLPASASGQVQYVVEVARILQRVPDHLGAGLCWWGAEFQNVNGVNEAGFNTTSFFDSTGNVLPVAVALGHCMLAPRLTGTLTDGFLVLNWPLSAAASALVVATNLQPAATWFPVTNEVQNVGTDLEVVLPLVPDICRFYRLQ